MLIGFAGFKGSGKDTAGDYMNETYGFFKIAFAEKLKKIIQEVFGFSDEQVYGKLKEVPDERYPFSGLCVICGTQCIRNEPHVEGPPLWLCPTCTWGYDHEHITPRLAMQTLGTEWGRRLYSNVWVDLTLRTIRESSHPNWAITDVRFKSEVFAIKNAGGIVVRLMRGELNSTHQSEKELTEMDQSLFDFTVDNNGPLSMLYSLLDDVHTAIATRL